MVSLRRRKERRGGDASDERGARDEGGGAPRSPNEVFRFDTRVR